MTEVEVLEKIAVAIENGSLAVLVILSTIALLLVRRSKD